MRYWARKTGEVITTVESYSHDLDIEGAIEITQAEYNDFIASLPIVKPEPIRDLPAEINELKARIEQLEGK